MENQDTTTTTTTATAKTTTPVTTPTKSNEPLPTPPPSPEMKSVDLNKSNDNVDETNSVHSESSIKNENELSSAVNIVYEHCCLVCKCYNYGEITHNVIEDCEILKSSIKFSSDDTSITSILSNRTWAEKAKIISKYNDLYNSNLSTDLKDHTHFNYSRALVSILTEPSIYDTQELERSIRTKNFASFTELLLTRTNTQKELLKRIYLVKYGKNIEHEVNASFKSTKDDMIRQLANALLNNSRSDNNSEDLNSIDEKHSNSQIDMNLIKEDSNKLYEAGESKKSTEQSVFIEILTTRSFSHLNKLNTFYQNSNPKGHSLIKAIELEFVKGKFQQSLLSIIQYSNKPYEYLAQRFNSSLSNELDLTRLTISHQYQAAAIKKAYLSLYNTSLVLAISSKTSSKYKKLILSMLNF